MTQTDLISDFSGIGGIAQPSLSPSSEVGQDQFLQLMLAQFKNQDPFEPMENGAFLSQLAQFSTASGIKELQTSFSDFSSSVYSDQALQGASLVGSDVLVGSEFLDYQGGNTVQGAIEIEGASGGVVIDIADASGQLIRSINLGVQPSGLAEFQWDGRMADQTLAGPGVYQFNARVVRGDNVESVPTLLRARVDSVTLGRNGQGLTLNSDMLGAIPMSTVRRIF